jgi:hypothetical protein
MVVANFIPTLIIVFIEATLLVVGLKTFSLTPKTLVGE